LRRTLVTALAVVSVLAGLTSPAGAAAPNRSSCTTVYSDVTAAHPFCGEIAWAVGRGITAGYFDGTIRPDTTVTRRAFAFFFFRFVEGSEGLPPPCTTSVAVDVSLSEPFCAWIAWLVTELGLPGFPEASFVPAALLDRVSLADWLYRLAGSPAGPFADPGLSDIPVEATNSVRWALAEGILEPATPTMFAPTVPLERSRLMAALYRFDDQPDFVPSSPVGLESGSVGSDATVRWRQPDTHGGSPITSYTVTEVPGGAQHTMAASERSVTFVAGDTTTGARVRATNVLGDGPESEIVAIADPPATPTVEARGFDGGGAVAWGPSIVGTAVTAVEVVIEPGGVTEVYPGASGGFQLFFGLANGVEHTATVTALTGPIGRSAPVEVAFTPTARACWDDAYTDVDAGNAFCGDITWMTTEGIGGGYSDATYRPSNSVSRQAMAAFLARFEGVNTAGHCQEWYFTDVPAIHPFCDEIGWLVDIGVTGGYADETFRPTAPVTRQAMAAFLARFEGADVEGTCDPGLFTDVPLSNAFCDEITWLAGSGIAGGYDDGTFRPTAPVTRQAMSAFLYRLDHLPA